MTKITKAYRNGILTWDEAAEALSSIGATPDEVAKLLGTRDEYDACCPKWK